LLNVDRVGKNDTKGISNENRRWTDEEKGFVY
jgi:hypothetical protein